MSDYATLTAGRVPTVYFIDDSATMREVIKIAFRKENVQVITCADAASALAQFSEAAPDAVITDVIMPDKDGYEVCDFIKHHERFSRTPVILMSGVVNKTVAEKAMSVKADELIRKPFHPQDLIGRVKGLLGTKIPLSPTAAPATVPAAMPQSPASQVLTNFFAPAPTISVQPARVGNGAAQGLMPEARSGAPAKPASTIPFMASVSPVAISPPSAPVAAPVATSAETQKLRNEIRRLELLVKKLQAELEAGKEYCASLEAHVKTMQD